MVLTKGEKGVLKMVLIKVRAVKETNKEIIKYLEMSLGVKWKVSKDVKE